MRLQQVLFISFVIIGAFATDITSSAAADKARKELEKTQWGQLGLAMLEVQMATNGPLDELVTSFQQLLRDLQFKIDTNVQEYHLKTQDHLAIENPILARISSAQADIAGFNAKLDNDLRPYATQLEQQIANDNTLIEETTNQKDLETAERNTQRTAHEDLYQLTSDQRDAVSQAIDLLHGLKNDGQAAFVQVKVNAMKEQLMKVRQLMKQINSNDPMLKVLLTLVQNFTDQGSLARVLTMMHDILTSINEQLTQMEETNSQEEGAYQTMQDQYQTTLDLANGRNLENGALLKETNKTIETVEDQKVLRQGDLDQANLELDAETLRWTGETQVHEELMESLNSELDAINSCIDIFMNAELSNTMLDRLDQM